MLRAMPIMLVAGTALAACETQQPPQIGELLPSELDIDSRTEAPAHVATGLDTTYETQWECSWSGVPKTWKLPVVKVVDGEALAMNEWTRLDGAVTRAPETDEATASDDSGPVGELKLTGERRSEDGGWYAMSMVGPVYRDRPSQLHGYWKGALCEADLEPINSAQALKADADPA